jgi:hypothetical protein
MRWSWSWSGSCPAGSSSLIGGQLAAAARDEPEATHRAVAAFLVVGSAHCWCPGPAGDIPVDQDETVHLATELFLAVRPEFGQTG